MKLLYFLLALANAEWVSPTSSYAPSPLYLRGTVQPEIPNKKYTVDILFLITCIFTIILSNILPPKKHEYRIANAMPLITVL